MTYRDAQEQPEPEPEVTVAIYDAPHEAHLAILHLETRGIAARTLNELVVGMAPHFGGGSGGIHVVVRESDAAEAHQALERLRRELALERERRRAETAPEKGGSPGWRFALMMLCLLGFTLWYWLR